MKKTVHLVTVAAAVAAALAFAACSNNDNGTGPGTDNTPPAVTSVGAVDAHHVNIRFSEDVDRSGAETESNYSIASTGGSAVSVAIANASLDSDGRTVMLTTTDALTTTGYQITVNNVEDMHGNAVRSATTKQFAGSSIVDATPPEIVHRTPAADETRVNATDSITVEFSEPVAASNFESAFALRSNGVTVPVTITTTDDVHFTIHPENQLGASQLYTITLTGVQDASGNVMPSSTWAFHTGSSTGGGEAPHLVTSTPANNATNVGLSSNIMLTFSEPVDTMSFAATFTPDLGVDVTPAWSNGNKTATFTPPGGLMANQQYVMTILPNGVKSVGGTGNTEPITLTFTTGAALEVGSISGSVTGNTLARKVAEAAR